MKSIISVLGKDKVGIVARVCAYLADTGVNILDMSQTIVQGNFNMLMVVEIPESQKNFETLVVELEALGQDVGVVIKVQHEDIFNCMHRI